LVISKPRFIALAGAAAIALAACAGAAQAQDAPAWTRGATCYEVFVRSFYDSDGDGIGDLKGVIAKLDYINDGDPLSTHSLGARCIWLMPIDESPSYHGYDVTNYYRVAPALGTNEDFARLMTAAHGRGIRVIVDLVLNHSSDAHPYFQEALRDTASPYRAWYRWSPTKIDKGTWGSELWHKSPVRDEYYYGLFSPRMPDLNYESPAVVEEAKRIAKFWLDSMHVDGFRLDAVSYLVEHGARLMHTPETHALLREWKAYVRGLNADAFTVGEVTFANDTLLSYYPDQLTSYFAFELADSLISAVRSGSARGLLVPALQLERTVPKGRWSPFLSNHDQTRVLTQLGGDVARARIAALLLLTMPGMPFVYYGEEIGMTGAKPDERIRTPMQWSREAGAGFTRGTPWEQLQNDSLTTTVSAENLDGRSLLGFYRQLIHLRSRCDALANGALVLLTASNDAVVAYLRRSGEGTVLVVANLSDARLSGITISSDAGALPAGTWLPRDLVAKAAPAPLVIGKDGRARKILLPALAPREGHLFALERIGGTTTASTIAHGQLIRKDACSD
jgi:glycosidase